MNEDEDEDFTADLDEETEECPCGQPGCPNADAYRDDSAQLEIRIPVRLADALLGVRQRIVMIHTALKVGVVTGRSRYRYLGATKAMDGAISPLSINSMQRALGRVTACTFGSPMDAVMAYRDLAEEDDPQLAAATAHAVASRLLGAIGAEYGPEAQQAITGRLGLLLAEMADHPSDQGSG